VHDEPIVDLLTGMVVGFDALARWRQDSVLIARPASDPAVEKTGVIHEISEHVSITAASRGRAMAPPGPPRQPQRQCLSPGSSAPANSRTR
jgi:EAL domain-containing protein (putative c-di-GMP-specific phosphodiesterase class I)